jgi:hypothetical protein
MHIDQNAAEKDNTPDEGYSSKFLSSNHERLGTENATPTLEEVKQNETIEKSLEQIVEKASAETRPPNYATAESFNDSLQAKRND